MFALPLISGNGAEHVITTHQAPEVDGHDRRDLSLFRLGWDFVERRLALFDPISSVTIPNFCLLCRRYRTRLRRLARTNPPVARKPELAPTLSASPASPVHVSRRAQRAFHQQRLRTGPT